jgi:hypothetical protein
MDGASMIDKETAIAEIVHLCDDEDGFLVPLRSLRRFDKTKYDRLVAAMRAYRDAIAGEDTIDRRVAYSLHSLVLMLGDMVTVFPRSESDKRLIEGALAESWELVEEIFTPEWYRLG